LDKNYSYRFFETSGFPDHRKDSIFKTDFRVWLRFGWLSRLRESEISTEEKIETSLELCYQTKVNNVSAIELYQDIFWFYDCGEEDRINLLNLHPRAVNDLKERAENYKKKPKKIDHFWDFKEIWASFLSAYQIDLYKIQGLHWWGFMGLLGGLGAETPLGRLMQTRTLEKKPKKNDLLNSLLAGIPQNEIEEENNG
jgi:hypothetical protein